MIAPTLPDGLTEDLQTVRRTFELRFNPQGKVLRKRRYDATGVLIEGIYEPRWEMWDTDPDGIEYRFMTVEDDTGGFRQPGYWLVELMRKWNPERFGGDMNKMLLELMDEPARLAELSKMNSSDDFIDAIGNLAAMVLKPKERTLKSMGELEAIHADWQRQRAMGPDPLQLAAASAPSGTDKLIEVASR